MPAKEALRQSLLAAVQLISPGAPEAATEQGVQVLTDVLAAFADLVRGPAPEVHGIELVADDTQAKILALLQQIVDHNTRAERQLVASYRSLYTTPGEVTAGGISSDSIKAELQRRGPIQGSQASDLPGAEVP